MTTNTQLTGSSSAPRIPNVRGGLPWFGHMLNFARNPYAFVEKAAKDTGEIAKFKLLGQDIVLLTGDEASEVFYRSSDEELDQSAAYKLMTPIFGEGLVFDAPIDKKNEQLRMLMPSLQIEAMKSHSSKVVDEVETLMAAWQESGEIDLVSTMKQLTINTASHCLLGKEFRYELSEEFAQIYHDLEQGVSPLAYHFPYLPIPKFKRRDKARARLQQLVGNIVKKREAQQVKPNDMFQTLIDMSYKDGTKLDENEITGLLVGAIFAGHHTSSGTAAWLLIELLRNPGLVEKATAEIDGLFERDGAVTFQNLREMPILESVLKEVLRLHPPLIILMRQVSKDLKFKHYTIKKGDMVWACPPVTHRMESLFKNPMQFDPDRFSTCRKEDKNLMAYQPFGGGKHKCSGNAFAMFQIKAIFATLLRQYQFELVDDPQTYQDDYREMIVQPKSPCRVRYFKRPPSSYTTVSTVKTTNKIAASPCPFESQDNSKMCIRVDTGLCQSHGVCIGEAPSYFHLNGQGDMEIIKQQIVESDLADIEKAIQFCPNQALSLVKEDHHE